MSTLPLSVCVYIFIYVPYVMPYSSLGYLVLKASKEGGCAPNKADQLMCSGTTLRGKLHRKVTLHSL